MFKKKQKTEKQELPTFPSNYVNRKGRRTADKFARSNKRDKEHTRMVRKAESRFNKVQRGRAMIDSLMQRGGFKGIM